MAVQAMEEEGVPWELLYNLGTALVQRGAAGDDAAAESCLEQAAEVCREVRVVPTYLLRPKKKNEIGVVDFPPRLERRMG